MGCAGVLAGGGEALESGFRFESEIQGNQLANFVAAGMEIGLVNSGHFNADQHFRGVLLEKLAESNETVDLDGSSGDDRAQIGKAVGPGQLVGQGAKITSDFEYFARFSFCLI